jgi:hypothetical protein
VNHDHSHVGPLRRANGNRGAGECISGARWLTGTPRRRGRWHARHLGMNTPPAPRVMTLDEPFTRIVEPANDPMQANSRAPVGFGFHLLIFPKSIHAKGKAKVGIAGRSRLLRVRQRPSAWRRRLRPPIFALPFAWIDLDEKRTGQVGCRRVFPGSVSLCRTHYEQVRCNQVATRYFVAVDPPSGLLASRVSVLLLRASIGSTNGTSLRRKRLLWHDLRLKLGGYDVTIWICNSLNWALKRQLSVTCVFAHLSEC